MMLTDTSTYLGPATILATNCRDGWVEVRLGTGAATQARLALLFAYRPSPGDEVLVIAQEEEQAYVIGMLKAAGSVTLHVPGDLELQVGGHAKYAAKGALTLCSAAALAAEAPTITFRANSLTVLARRLVERLGSAFVWVQGLFQVKAARMRTIAEGDYVVKAGRTHLRAKDDCAIDARTIHLG